MTFAHGRWEHLQFADIYVIHPDGTGLKRVGDHGNFCGSPKWTADSQHVIAYCMDVEKTLETRRASPLPGNDTRLVSIDVASGATTDVPAGPGVKFNPSVLVGRPTSATSARTATTAGIYYTSGARGPRGQVRAASWSPDGSRVVFHRRQAAPTTWWKNTWSRNPEFELALTSIMPSFGRDGRRFVVTGRPPRIDSRLEHRDRHAWIERRDGCLSGSEAERAGAAMVAERREDHLCRRHVQCVLQRIQRPVSEAGDRAEGGAQIAIINPDGTGFRELTTGPNNSAFPSMAPDGKRFVYRTFGPDGDGLKIMNIETNAITMLTKGYDNFPLWSPRGDLIMFSRLAEGDYDIYTIKPDGTGLKRITNSRGNDAHQAWSPDGEQIVVASSRMGFKDEGVYTDAPQPYGELFVMRYDGTDVRQLTDNQWEDGTPAWQPNAQVTDGLHCSRKKRERFRSSWRPPRESPTHRFRGWSSATIRQLGRIRRLNPIIRTAAATPTSSHTGVESIDPPRTAKSILSSR